MAERTGFVPTGPDRAPRVPPVWGRGGRAGVLAGWRRANACGRGFGRRLGGAAQAGATPSGASRADAPADAVFDGARRGRAQPRRGQRRELAGRAAAVGAWVRAERMGSMRTEPGEASGATPGRASGRRAGSLAAGAGYAHGGGFGIRPVGVSCADGRWAFPGSAGVFGGAPGVAEAGPGDGAGLTGAPVRAFCEEPGLAGAGHRGGARLPDGRRMGRRG
jgi:hypothetical protein